MTVSQPASVTYFAITPQWGQRHVAVEERNFFSGPASLDYAKVVSRLVSGNPAFERIEKADGDIQFFTTKNVVCAICTAKSPIDAAQVNSTRVDITFDNYDFGVSITLADTQQNVAATVQRELNSQSILTLSDGYSQTIVAKVSRIADVAVSPLK